MAHAMVDEIDPLNNVMTGCVEIAARQTIKPATDKTSEVILLR